MTKEYNPPGKLLANRRLYFRANSLTRSGDVNAIKIRPVSSDDELDEEDDEDDGWAAVAATGVQFSELSIGRVNKKKKKKRTVVTIIAVICEVELLNKVVIDMNVVGKKRQKK